MVKYEEIKDQFDIWLVNGDNSIQNVFLKNAEISTVTMPVNPDVRLLRIKDAFGRCFLVSESRWFWTWEDASKSLKDRAGDSFSSYDDRATEQQQLDNPSD